jgi:hypothetical protein
MPPDPVVQAPTEPVQPVVAPQPAPVVAEPAVAVETPVVAPQTILTEAIDKANEPPKENITQSTEVTPPGEDTGKTDTKVTEGGQSEDTAPPPKYDPFKLPEGISLQQERVSEFTALLADLETKGKADHTLVQEFGQKAVDFHVAEMTKLQTELTKLYQTAWDRQKVAWKDQFLKDPELGGNRTQTTVDSALTFIRTHGGTAEQQTEFRNLMETSGLGNHPAMIRLLASAGRAMSEGKPLAAPKPVPNEPKSKVKTLYGG